MLSEPVTMVMICVVRMGMSDVRSFAIMRYCVGMRIVISSIVSNDLSQQIRHFGYGKSYFV